MSTRSRTIALAARRLRSLRVPRWVVSEGWFDATWYCERYPEVGSSGIDPLVHFWRHGRFEARSPAPHVDLALHEALHPSGRVGRGLRQLRRGRTRDERVPELESGLFDPAWYARRYPEALSEQHPLAHYYRACCTGARPDPGPLFDTAAYLTERPAAARATTPLAHYHRHGGRLAVPSASSPRGEVLRPHIGGRRRADVAVMIHAFHLELLGDLLAAIRPLGRSATVYISVCDPTHVRRASRLVSKTLGRSVRRTVRHVPNRGRNFGPLLCSFGADIARHDLLLHLHTKKSLHSGAERSDWREHLTRSLAGPAIAAVLEVFAEHADVGVVQPEQFHVMPPWSSHWLGNVSHGRAVFARCGLDPAEVDGYLDYPVGGMFWARVDAIRPLLDAGFAIDDFEPEAGQTDCTLAHAIERSITPVARAQGFRFVEVGYDEREWRLDWSRRGTDDFGIHDRGLLRRQLADADLVSVDLFDTILLRPTLDPTSLQYFAARAVSDDAVLAERMVEDRILAEHAARVRHHERGDVTLDEIYDEAAATLRPLMEAEVAIEPRVAIPRQWLIDDLRAARPHVRRMIVITDTTLDRPTIEGLLVSIGADDLFDELYVSNERRARKDTGTVWPLVAAAEGVPPERWLHIGDNERSDAQQALSHRLCWSHVPSPRAVAQFHAPLPRAGWATRSALGLSAVTLYDGTRVVDPDVAFGRAVLGPLLVSFLGALSRRRNEQPGDRLLLLARDGELIHRAATAVGIDCDYFLVSRRAALAVAQAREVDVDLLLDSGAFEGDLRDLVEARTGLRPDDRHAAMIDHPRERERAAALLSELGPELQAHGRRQLVGLEQYLRSLDIGVDTPLCLVDLGYSATTQRALARVLPNPIAGLYCATTPTGAAAGGVGWFADGVPFWSGNWFLDHSLLLEALLSEVGGPVLGYREDGTVVRGPVSDVDSTRIERVRAAALQFLDDLLAMYGPAVITDVVDPAEVLRWVAGIPERFLPDPATLFAGLRIENGFVGRTSDDAASGPRSDDRTSDT